MSQNAGKVCSLSTKNRCEFLQDAYLQQAEAQAFNAAVLDAMAPEVVVVDAQGTILSVNESWVRFSIENSKVEGTAAPGTEVGSNYLSSCDSPEALPIRIGIQSVLDQKTLDFRMEYPCDTGFKKLWFSLVATPIDLGTKGVGAVIVHTDITERKLAEFALKESHEQLLQAAKMATLGELSAGVAHEVNNPLSVILGGLRSLEKFRDDNEKFTAKLLVLTRSAHRIEKIVQGLKKFSRKSDGSDYVLLALGPIVQECIVLTESKAKRHSVLIECELLTDRQVMGDEGELEQVIINLVNNAIDAVVSLDEKWVKVKVFENDHEIVLQVHDSGAGISPVIEKVLFEPFFTTKPAGEGTGLGLSIAKKIIEQHGASICVNRDVPHTCFEIRFKSEKPVVSPVRCSE